MAMKKAFNAGLVVLVLLACGAAVWMLASYFGDREPVDYEVDLVVPEAGSSVSSPLTLTGRAHDNWFYNDSFPVEVQDIDENILGETVATRQPGVKSEDGFYTFTATVEFSATPGSAGYVVLKRSNPGGQHSNYSTNVPITF